jgi:hypothetical protein
MPWGRAIETRLKKEFTDPTSHPVVERIEAYLANRKDKKVFALAAFEGIFRDQRTPTAEKVRHIKAAGLIDLGRRIVDGRKPRLFIRDGWEIRRQGDAWFVEGDEGYTMPYLTALDEGRDL